MRDQNLLGPWIRRFLLEHLVAERNLARNTQISYRDTLTLLLPFTSQKTSTPIDRLSVEDIAPNLVRAFLDCVERERGCGAVTRNQRLAAIHSLAQFIGTRSPEHLAWCTDIRSIPFKKAAKAVIGYLERKEIDALLHAPDQRTKLGARDHALLLFLYNSGARASEAAGLRVGHLQFGTPPSVRILGKGNKWRICPLWPVTVDVLRQQVSGRTSENYVFQGRTGEPMTRFGIFRLVTTYANIAGKLNESIQGKRVSPHTIRHTTAVHLLRAGVDINTIRAWLGHVSLDTTNIYAEVDLELKAKALASVEIIDSADNVHRRPPSPSLMEFMRRL